MITAKQKRIQRKDRIAMAVCVVMGTPLIIVWIIGAALRMGAFLS